MMQRSIYSKAALCCILSFFFLIVCIGKATIMQTALTNSLTICLTTILPSLTAMMILTRILTESGLLEQWNFLFGRLFHFLFRLPANFCSIFFISQIAGYPVGAIFSNACKCKKRTFCNYQCLLWRRPCLFNWYRWCTIFQSSSLHVSVSFRIFGKCTIGNCSWTMYFDF